jgi:hypothetical protein
LPRDGKKSYQKNYWSWQQKKEEPGILEEE